MGNCMETCMQWPVAEPQIHEQNQKQEAKVVVEEEEEEEEEGGEKKRVVRVKLVLTREELEWLVLELKGHTNGSVGKRRLEDVLAEIERARGCSQQRWRPSLQSIMEGPELPQMDTFLLHS